MEEGMATHSSIPAWRIPWQRSLVDYSWDTTVTELDNTEATENVHVQTYLTTGPFVHSTPQRINIQ